MTLDEITSFNFANKNVCIIGYPASGKTFLSDLICNDTHHKIHTDKYIKDGYSMALHSVLNELSFIDNKPTLIEGVIGYRLLRKGVELGLYYPDIIIKIEISQTKQKEIYTNERDVSKLKFLETFNTTNEKIFTEYLENCPHKKIPLIINFYNTF